ncbi:50S ribosomal protein L29 [Candidatus Coxiella mudrowiae]|uniref:Large ribosomal subunit protein uL29 n=1 Tax=Candidatus Coxiella mudrowiae TaxID=2054173 RepID=A0ABM5UVH8_9COXI|nr:50S ribosomal protein L29 [Candidatus Coxiella mudrowiae]AKQ33909.1 50S ribosomal protein L29 [Candidatus Coxiella mudrowiae]
MKTNDLRNKTEAELKKEFLELLKEQFNFRMQKGMGEVPRPHLYKKVRRNIARIKTLLREKERTV